METKVWSFLCERARGGSSGAPANMGHTCAFGNTWEHAGVLNMGREERGAPHDGAFNHVDGSGHVPRCEGQYHDAIAKGNGVITVLVEALGGMAPEPARRMRFLARIAKRKGPRQRDSTRYTSSWTATPPTSHHSQRIATAAVMADADAIATEAAISLACAVAMPPPGSPAIVAGAAPEALLPLLHPRTPVVCHRAGLWKHQGRWTRHMIKLQDMRLHESEVRSPPSKG